MLPGRVAGNPGACRSPRIHQLPHHPPHHTIHQPHPLQNVVPGLARLIRRKERFPVRIPQRNTRARKRQAVLSSPRAVSRHRPSQRSTPATRFSYRSAPPVIFTTSHNPVYSPVYSCLPPASSHTYSVRPPDSIPIRRAATIEREAAGRRCKRLTQGRACEGVCREVIVPLFIFAPHGLILRAL